MPEFAKVVFKVYVAGLYLSDKKSTVPEVLAVPGAKRIQIVALRDISSEDFGQAFMTGMRKIPISRNAGRSSTRC